MLQKPPYRFQCIRPGSVWQDFFEKIRILRYIVLPALWRRRIQKGSIHWKGPIDRMPHTKFDSNRQLVWEKRTYFCPLQRIDERPVRAPLNGGQSPCRAQLHMLQKPPSQFQCIRPCQVRYGCIRRSSASPRPPCDGTPSSSVWP